MANKANQKKEIVPEPLVDLISKNYNLRVQMSDPGPIKAWGKVSTRGCHSNRYPHWPQLYSLGDPIHTTKASVSGSGLRKTLELESFRTLREIHRICPGGWRWWDYTITKHNCNKRDQYSFDNDFMQFTNVIEFQGKLYALSFQGSLAVLEEDIKKQLTITGVSRCRAVPSMSAKYFNQHFLESNGEILLIFLVHQKSLSVVDKVEIFRLDFPTLELIKLEKLGGRTVFLKENSCIWVNSAKVGCEADCVYFTLDDKWWKYDMGSDCVSAAWITKPNWAY